MHQTKYSFIFSVLPGLSVFVLAEFFSFLNPILTGLLVGILMGNFIKLSDSLKRISQKSGNRFLEFSVLFLAFGINYSHLTKLGWESLGFLFFMILMVLSLSFFISKKPLNWLIGFGTAICGSSAIAALAPTLEKEKGDTGIAMAVVNLYGMMGMVILPFIFLRFDLKPINDALIIGGSLHSLGNVAGAGYMMSDQIGELSVTVKMARVTMLSFGLIFFNFLAQNRKNLPWTSYFKLPWYIWGFMAITILVSMVAIPEKWMEIIDLFAKLLLTIAMTNIGLQIRFRDLVQSGKKGLVFGLGIWIFQFVLLFLFLFWIN